MLYLKRPADTMVNILAVTACLCIIKQLNGKLNNNNFDDRDFIFIMPGKHDTDNI